MAGTVHGGPQDNIDEHLDDVHQGTEVIPAKGNFVAVPIPISNPTVGTGLQAALLYLHPKMDDSQSQNSTSGIVGMYTDSNSWIAGIFHDGYWAVDTYKFTGYLGGGDLNLKYYGIGDDPVLSDHPIDYKLAAFSFSPRLQRRIPSTENWYAGIHYLFIDTDTIFETSEEIPGLPDFQGEIRTAGFGLITTYDSRDDNYYPVKGQRFHAMWTNYGETWGGDQEYNKFTTFINHYQPIIDKTVLALRCNLQASEGDVPFFDLPYLDIRGVARSRYTDQFTLSVHAEGRHKFQPRWGVVAFVEAGWFGEDIDSLTSGRTIVSYGGGLRWQVTKEKKLNLGLDFAISTDDQAFLIQIGEKF
jgi:outer membrane protein assembly factor BamA